MKIAVKGHPEGYLVQNFPANVDQVELSCRQVLYLLNKIGLNSAEELQLHSGGQEFHIVTKSVGFSKQHFLRRGSRNEGS